MAPGNSFHACGAFSTRHAFTALPADAPAWLAAPADAEYSQLEQRLLALGHPPRLPGEPPLRWLRRLGLRDCEGEVLAYYRRRHGRGR